MTQMQAEHRDVEHAADPVHEQRDTVASHPVPLPVLRTDAGRHASGTGPAEPALLRIIRRTALTDTTQLRAAYGTALGGQVDQAVTKNCSEEAAAELVRLKDKLGPRITTISAFIQVSRFIGDTAECTRRADLVLALHAMFDPGGTGIRADLANPAMDVAAAESLLAAIPSADAPAMKAVEDWFGFKRIQAMFAVGLAPVVPVLAAVSRTGPSSLGLVPDKDPARLGELIQVFGAVPPGKMFVFPGWGAAEAADADENIDVHLLKHVFASFPSSQTAPPDQELAYWWTTLGVDGRLSALLPSSLDLAASGVGPLITAALDPTAAASTLLGSVLDIAQPTHRDLVARMCATSSEVRDHLVARYRAAYRDTALASVGTPTAAKVHVFKSKFMVSVVQVPFFGVGRALAGAPRLSSAYWSADATAKLSKIGSETLWDL